MCQNLELETTLKEGFYDKTEDLFFHLIELRGAVVIFVRAPIRYEFFQI